MDPSGEEERGADVRRVRRCVQSKLSWGRTAPGRAHREAVDLPERSKGKRKRSNPTKNKSSFNCKKAQRGNKKSLATVKASESNQKEVKQAKEQYDVVSVQVGTSGKSFQHLKNVNCGHSSPCKDPASGACNSRHSHAELRLTNDTSDAAKHVNTHSQHAPHPVFDLWMETKKAAEENVRLSVGKQTHPFFNCRKATKRIPENQDITKVGSRNWSNNDRGNFVFYPPIHVFDEQTDNVASLDWRNWSFKQRTLVNLTGCCASESTQSFFKDLVQPLKLDTACCKKRHTEQVAAQTKTWPATSAICTSTFANGEVTNKQLLSELQTHINSTISLLSRCNTSVANFDNGHHARLLNERLASYNHHGSYLPPCSLWTNKYQPENTLEVCGNSESVRFLCEWLNSWHERGSKSRKNVKHGDCYTTEDDEDSLYEDESDMDAIDGDSTKNVLLVTGPVGSGKSAAIYACAKEQGFEIIEVSASDLRNGALVKEKFGEAVESHGFNKWSVEDPLGRTRNLELMFSQSGIIEVEGFDNDPLEVDLRTCNQDIPHTECLGHKSPASQVANKSLILFEDVDTVFDEDRGFISTILQLAETTKRPIILTSNNKNPTLPQRLGQLVLDFVLPSSEELFSHLLMVAGAEGAEVSSQILQQLVNSCLSDIRKTLLLLQFWCQGNARKIDRDVQCTYWPLHVDIDAAHLVIPKVIPWEFPCKLSEKVEEEISKAILMVEETSLFIETENQQDFNPIKGLDCSKMGYVTDTVKTRKKGKLKKKCSFSEQFSAPIKYLEDFSDASDFPVTHNHHTVRRKHGAVLSSQSDDELPTDIFPTSCMMSVDPNIQLLSDVHVLAPVQMNDAQNYSEVPIDSTNQSRGENVVLNQFERERVLDQFESFVTASTSHVCDTFQLQDVSCVPESSFVSSSKNSKDDCASMVVSSNNHSVSLANFISSIPAPPEADFNSSDRDISEPHKCSGQNLGSGYEIDVESVHGNEELKCSQNESDEPQAIGYQVMDECSRADFSMHMVPRRNIECSLDVDLVSETWRNLHGRREDLKTFLATNHRDASSIVKLASGLTDLISTADVMLSGCSPHLRDILEPSRTPCNEPDAFSWYDEQWEVGSMFIQHGLCLYTNKCSAVGSKLGCQITMDLAQEMLASSMNTMAIGKLLAYKNSYIEEHLQAPRCAVSLERGLESALYSAMLSIVPARSSMTLKGSAFHEYLSFMSQISKLESSRLLKSMNEKQPRRSRTSRHYLSSGQLPLSPEHVDLLAGSFCFNEVIL